MTIPPDVFAVARLHHTQRACLWYQGALFAIFTLCCVKTTGQAKSSSVHSQANIGCPRAAPLPASRHSEREPRTDISQVELQRRRLSAPLEARAECLRCGRPQYRESAARASKTRRLVRTPMF